MSNETTVNTAAQQEHMPDYNRTLGFWDLFFIAVGVIIGSGVLVFTGRGIAQTGRSVCLAYLGAAVWVVCTAIPTFLMCSCIRLLGGAYTQCNLFLGERWGGFYLCLYFLSQMGLNLYAQTFALYFCELFGGGNEKLIAAIMITFFYILNFFGVDFMSKAQNLMSIILLLALIWFTVRGLPRVDWANFFGGEGWMTNGWGGLFATSTLLTYSLMGATSLMPYSAQAKNPQRDIPLAGAISTFSIAILFALMGIVFPEQWEKSIFRMPRPVFNVVMWICFFASLSNVWGQITNSDAKTIFFNVAIMVVGVVFSLVWYKSGKVHPSKSYELEA